MQPKLEMGKLTLRIYKEAESLQPNLNTDCECKGNQCYAEKRLIQMQICRKSVSRMVGCRTRQWTIALGIVCFSCVRTWAM